MSDALECWHCGRGLEDVLKPLVRSSVCPACDSDLYVCRMCYFFAPSVAKSCREPVAEEVRDKTRANFCDYFQARAGAHAGSAESDKAKSELGALFGLSDEPKRGSAQTPDATAMEQQKKASADASSDELRRLFGLDDN